MEEERKMEAVLFVKDAIDLGLSVEYNIKKSGDENLQVYHD